MDIKNKIKKLVKGGFQQAAFSQKKNALLFAKLWNEKGYKISGLRTSGPTVEGPIKRKAYYVIADRSRRRKNSKRKKISSS